MQRFKKLRILNRKTQTELGKFLGLSRAEYDAYEKGDTPITPEIESALSKYYNVENLNISEQDNANESGTEATIANNTNTTDSVETPDVSPSEKPAESKPVNTDFDYRERLVEMVKILNNENTGIYGGKKLNKYEYKTLLRQMKNIVLLLDDLRNDK